MTATTVQYLTFEEFEQLPDQPGKLELLRGELIDLPPAKRRHNETAEKIFFLLTRIVREGQVVGRLAHLGRAHHEMGYRFTADSWLQPDVSITHAGQKSGDYFLGAPALAVEVVSERNTASQMNGKIAEYLAGGALEVWVLYPNRTQMWVYKPDGTAEMQAGEFASAVLGGERVDVAALLRE
jgi:Uma2 family endonuclease